MYRLVLLSIALGLTGCARQESSPQPGNASAASTQAAVSPQRASGEVRVTPSEAAMGTPMEIAFTLKDSHGQTIADAEVQAVFIMEMGNMTMREPVALKWTGYQYVGRYSPTMAGEWELNVEARKGGQLLLSIPSTVQVRK